MSVYSQPLLTLMKEKKWQVLQPVKPWQWLGSFVENKMEATQQCDV